MPSVAVRHIPILPSKSSFSGGFLSGTGKSRNQNLCDGPYVQRGDEYSESWLQKSSSDVEEDGKKALSFAYDKVDDSSVSEAVLSR